MSLLLVAMGLWACGGTVMVQAEPQTALLDQTYQPNLVRDAIARSINHRRLAAQGEAPGMVNVSDQRHGCSYTFQYGPSNVVVTALASGPPAATAPAGPPMVSKHCEQQAAALAKAVVNEVQAPAREAAKAAKDERNAAVSVARAQAAAQAAALARDQLAQQAATQGDGTDQGSADPASDGTAADPGQPDPSGAAAPANNPVVYSNTQINNTVRIDQRYAAPGSAAPAAPRMRPNTLCVGGQAFVCPSASALGAAVRLRDRSQTGGICPLDRAQSPLCPPGR